LKELKDFINLNTDFIHEHSLQWPDFRRTWQLSRHFRMISLLDGECRAVNCSAGADRLL